MGERPSTARAAFARWLIAARGDRSVNASARLASFSPSTLLRAERGDHLLRPENLRRLCTVYGVDFDTAHELMLAAAVERERWHNWRT